MSAISVTASSIVKTSNTVVANGTAGASITAGQVVYLDATTNTYKLADCDLSPAAATAAGIALNAATSGQPIAIATSGDLTFNAVLTAGKAYVLGATAGEINPIADLTTNWRTTLLFIATSTTNARLLIYASGVANA